MSDKTNLNWFLITLRDCYIKIDIFGHKQEEGQTNNLKR